VSAAEGQANGHGTLLRHAGISSFGAALALVSGLALDVSIAARFGAGRTTDAFFVASRIPIAAGVVLMAVGTQAILPSLARWRIDGGDHELWRLTSLVLLGAALVGSLFAALGVAFAEPLMRLTAPGLPGPEATLAASIARTMFLIVPLIAIAETLRGLLNALYSFGPPAAMNVAMNLTAALLVLTVASGHIHVVAWAYVAGALAQLIYMAITAARQGFRLRPHGRLRSPEVVAVGRLSVRPAAASALNPLARVGEQLIASFLPPGSITILTYANRLISAIGGGFFFRPVVVALMPRLAEADTDGSGERRSALTRTGLRIMLAVSVPLTAAMAILARPAVQVLFRRGNFSRSATTLLGITLAVYAASLIGSAVQRVLLAPFFAALDTRTPLRNTIYGVVANLVFIPPLVFAFGIHEERAAIGVAIAYSLAQYVNVGHAWYRLRASFGVALNGVGSFGVRLGIASAGAAAVMVVVGAVVDLLARGSRLEVIVRMAVVTAAGAAVFLPLTLALNGAELRRSWQALRRRPQTVHDADAAG
jgi:murein biosynthesis integral membrane protein MurJ